MSCPRLEHHGEAKLPASEEATGSREEARAGREDRKAPGATPGRLGTEGVTMSKGMDRKKEGKKKPAKTADEKRAAKREKAANKR